MRSAAFFDLDGTLLTVNSARLWVKRERRLGRISVGQLLHAGLFLGGYHLGVLDMEAALGVALAQIKGVREEDVRADTGVWWREDVRAFVAPKAQGVLAAHRQAGEPLVLLTSSSRYASEQASAEFGLDAALFQGYEVRDGCFTGAPAQPLCYGPGKVLAAEAWAKEQDDDLGGSAFYTDSFTDVPMLERVGKPFAVHPDPRLKRLAKARGWPILDWRA
jgi:HAD superfamily hydrolase (TIGR01490 family)